MINIEQKLPGIQKNISLKNHTTFKIGGSAKYFFIAKNEKEITKAVKTAKELNLKYFILGGGSNILIFDKGFDGLVVKIQNFRLRFQKNFGGQAKLKTIYVDAGVKLGELVKFSVDNNLTGMEWAAGIPGTLGGAIRGNAGAFNYSISDFVKTVEILDIQGEKIQNPKSKIQKYNSKLKTFKNEDCGFEYRNSVFKRNKNLIILAAEIRLEKGNSETSKKKIQEYLQKRKSVQPLKYPSAGSVFKNILFSEISPEAFKKCPKLEQFCQAGKIPVGWLIENAGLKGKKIGGAQVSEKHSNFIINTGNARAEDVVILISLIKQKVRNKFDLQLMEEIEYIGF
jgi:UDP-N-acetylmuramate dehydrogenase